MATVTWGSKKQKSVALSSCEAEIVAASEAGKEAVYLQRFLQELGVQDDSPTHMHVDNSAARDLAYNAQHHDRVKHIARRHFWIRELVEEGQLVVPLVATEFNLADFFTKPLPPKRFISLRNSIMNIPKSAFD